MSCVGYFVEKTLNSRSNFAKVEDFMLSRFGSRGFNFINYDDSGYFFFKFDNEEIKNKVISLGPIKLEGNIFVFFPMVNKYPAVVDTLVTCQLWVKISNIPRLYWNEEGLTYIAQTLGAIVRKDVGYTWRAIAENKTSHHAYICVEMSVAHGRPQKLLVYGPWDQ